ncbi:MAG: excinuclease ATPase subunit [Burkholderiaceae bacterium]
MNLIKPALALLACALVTGQAVARDTEYKLKFADVLALNDPNIKVKLDDSIKLYFADQPTPKVLSKLGEDTSNKKTNGFGKDDEFGCKWAAYSALVALQERAKHLGANAVVNIVSNYKKDPFSSQTDYECHAGAFVIGVALKGTFVKIAP